MALGACGEVKNETAASTTTATTTTAKAKADPASDMALARSAVLSATDLPGYTGKADTSSGSMPESAKKEFATCLGVSSTVLDDKAGEQKAESGDFDKGDSTVSGSVTIDPLASDIDDSWKVMSKQGVEPCLQGLFKAAIAASAGTSGDVTIGDVTVDRFDVGVGTRSVGYSLKMVATSQGTDVNLFMDLLFVARDRAGIELDGVNVGEPFDRVTELGLVQKMYDRIGTKAA